MSEATTFNAPLPFEALAEAIGADPPMAISAGFGSIAPSLAEAWSSLPYRPLFVGDTETGVLHGGVVTAMLDESCGMAVRDPWRHDGAPSWRQPRSSVSRANLVG